MRLWARHPAGGPLNPPFMDEGDWIDMTIVPLIAVEGATTDERVGDAGNEVARAELGAEADQAAEAERAAEVDHPDDVELLT